jgi:4-hydroxy-3-methylbut-2-enyl diphosphate reductase
MRIIRAEHLGMCFGVRDAIAMAGSVSSKEPLTILGDLVHNDSVLKDLRERGAQIARGLEDARTQSVMITAHGASDKAILAARQAGKTVIEATCPLVHAAHRALKSLVRDGFHPVIIGKKDHVEVRGMTEDLASCDVVLTGAEIFNLAERARFGVVAQTTQPIERARHLAGLLRWRFPGSEVRFIDTVCQPTKQRQNAAMELAGRVNVVIVVGGVHSNNTRELARACGEKCRRVYQVESAADLRPEWLDGAAHVGLTAGTSTPDSVIEQVDHALRAMAARIEAREAAGAMAC